MCCSTTAREGWGGEKCHKKGLREEAQEGKVPPVTSLMPRDRNKLLLRSRPSLAMIRKTSYFSPYLLFDCWQSNSIAVGSLSCELLGTKNTQAHIFLVEYHYWHSTEVHSILMLLLLLTRDAAALLLLLSMQAVNWIMSFFDQVPSVSDTWKMKHFSSLQSSQLYLSISSEYRSLALEIPLQMWMCPTPEAAG